MEGWIKLHRSIVDWEWWDDQNCFRLFTTCLIFANHKDKKYRGKLVPRGSFLTGWQDLANRAGLSVQNTRTAFRKLESTSELTRKSTGQGTLVTVVKYGDFQVKEKDATSELTSKSTGDQQAVNKPLTTTKNEKNEKKGGKRFVKPSIHEVDNYGLSLDPPFYDSERFIDYYESKGWKVGKTPMKDWKAAVRNWNRKNKVNDNPKNPW
tara:strand:+ start:733 stop:1356 length:624 start_codon:yes stop_codon:yes gene_type:complete